MSKYGIPFDDNPSLMPQRPKSAGEHINDLKAQMLQSAASVYVAFVNEHPSLTAEATTVLVCTMTAINDCKDVG